MSQRRGITTDQLANIIQVIQLGKKTGTLTVERGQAATQEEGEMLFVRGHITSARCGRLLGQQALDWLASWGACRFLFVPTPEGQSNGYPTQFSPTTIRSASKDSNPRLLSIAPSLSQDDWPRITGPQPGVQATAATTPRRMKPHDEGVKMLAQTGLSRQHLRLFFLIDGQRNIPELVRLMGRRTEEVQQLLRDLEIIGVIQL